jgi:uncharacterized coiled-coil protein SlyX
MKRSQPIAVSVFIAVLIGQLHCTATAAPIDEFRLSEIEQNIRALQSQIREQNRTIDELQRQLSSLTGRPVNNANRNAASGGIANNNWLSVANWSRVKAGMSELEVIGVLGPPTQMRISDDKATRTLLYAMEIGSSGFLGGNVVFKEGRVVEINTPVLR